VLFGGIGGYPSRGHVLEKMAFYQSSIPTPASFFLIKHFPFDIEIRRPDFYTEKSLLHLQQKTACFQLPRLRNGRGPSSTIPEQLKLLQLINCVNVLIFMKI
jgi:hypothetical protein